ncbi:hypothetical protein ACH0B5_10115 [Ureibacillus sp. 179-F W5.1 NHS]|uniref:Uncharacterized protein n=1 Tax=Lysinibacillus halotolerans TaxID=1368476 RepID=A0A3M8H3Y6_9BACI|nr:hypothetical protein [Lysinibacillus halotolerans]RNC97186.1 hypothetical protein EC501_16500 [Lysinibacillus halotolerans]
MNYLKMRAKHFTYILFGWIIGFIISYFLFSNLNPTILFRLFFFYCLGEVGYFFFWKYKQRTVED